MREVKALAKLDNPHIVRYFNAWIENPPPGWQESQDADWSDTESFITGATNSNSQQISVNEEESSREISSIDSLAASRQKSQSTSDSSSDIVFENSLNFQNSSSETTPLKGQIEDSSESYSSKNTNIAKANIERGSSTAAKTILFIQMELCQKGSLCEWLLAHGSHRDINEVLNMFNQILQGVEYIHQRGLIYRDLKPSNILFALDGAIKIGDFGLVTALLEEASQESTGAAPGTRFHTADVGTRVYMSPEQIEGKPYSQKADIFPLGLIWVELLWPMSTASEKMQVFSQLRELKLPQGFTDKYPKEEILLHKMLSPNPDERPTASEIRNSALFMN